MDQTKPSATGKIVGALVIGLIIGFALGAFWESRRSGMPAVSESLAGAESSAAVAVSPIAEKMPIEGTNEKPMVVDVKINADSSAGTAVVVPVVTPTVAVSAAVVFVENQSAGTIVEVTRVRSAAPVWVAVREMKGGVAGNILGVRRVVAGETSAVSIELLRPTVKGGNYIVALYADNGDPAFNYREDILISGVQGAFVAE